MKHAVVAAVFVVAFFLASAAQGGQKKVLVIQSYAPSLSWTGQCDRGIARALGDQVKLRTVYLDTKRILKTEFRKRANAAMKVFREFNPDTVMLGDDNALRLLGPEIAETGKPVVYFGINNNPRVYFKNMPDNVTGIVERMPVFPWVRYLEDIVPKSKTVLMLSDDSSTAEATVKVAFGNRKQVQAGRVSVTYRMVSSWAEWRKAVLSQPSDSMIVLPVFHTLRDERGKHVPVEEVIKWISANSKVPVFAYQDYAVGDDGIVGAYVIQGEKHGRLAGQVVLSILKGEKSDVSNLIQVGAFYFNKKQLKRFDLKLPDNIRGMAIYK